MHVHVDARNEKTSRVLRVSLSVTLVYIVLLVVAALPLLDGAIRRDRHDDAGDKSGSRNNRAISAE